MPTSWGSLVEALRHHVREHPDHAALVFLPDGDTEVGRLSYAELDRRARVFAAQLQKQGMQGRPVLLMLPSSIYYVVAFVGCLYAGAIPVPGYPPTNSMHAQRLAHIVADCNAHGAIVATSSALGSIGERLRPHFPQGLDCLFIPVDASVDPDAAGPAEWQEPTLDRGCTAYLQYTSGSTSQPRGVVVTHGNLLSYCQSYTEAAAVDENDVFVTWLPLFHDMGLILGVVQALHAGATIVMMPPLCFLQKPLRWLQAISRYRGTISYAPNFAYELCASALDQALVNTLDLSSWSVAGNAAEPVHADTLDRFARRFEPCGYRRAAMNPSYGLAEATLTVSSHRRLQAPRVIEADPEELAAGRLAPPPSAERAHALVSCGRAWLDTRLAIVDPVTLEVCVDGRVGEVWAQGSLVAQGYWQRGADTADTFGARTSDGRGPWLRTGDLGLLQDGELYITGRLKDLIIIRGQNHYPQDIEHTMYRAHPALEVGHGAAFPVEVEGQERLVVVQEVRRSQRHKIDGAQAAQAIRSAIAEVHGLQVHAVQLLRPASVHITSSGKIQRRACKQSYLSGQFEVLHAWQEAPAGRGDASASVPGPTMPPLPQVIAWLQRQVAALQPQAAQPPAAQPHAVPLRVAPDDIDVHQSFSALGLDSLKLTALSAEFGRWLGIAIDPAMPYSHPTIDALARHATAAATSGRAAPRGQAMAEPIAVIGLACRFPGADSAEGYWRLLDQGVDAITEIPASRWNGDAHYQPGAPAPAKSSTKWGGFLDDIEAFDAQFFGISPREAAGMDPQQRLLLQASWHALEDAGIAPDTLAGSDTGVFIGAMTHDYELLEIKRHAPLDAYFGTGTHASILANRISYQFDLHGPSWVAETACSSSLVALHGARLSLQARECSVALVGGVNCLLTPELFIALSQAQMLSPDGRCMSFDARANGYVRSEGCAVLVLKRHADALRDNDRIHGVIRGTAINQDGRSNGITAPSGEAQQAVIRQALAVAGVDASDVSYVEAHGTGTSLGDPIEVDALKQTYGRPSQAQPTLWIGSAKSQIGHTEPVSGLAGLTKVLLALRHQRLPGNLHFEQLNPHIDLQGTRCAVLGQPQAWPRGAAPRVAAVSSFGFGGANAHVIVAEAPAAAEHATPAPATHRPEGPVAQLLTLSAKTPAALQRRAAQVAAWLEDDATLAEPARFHALCHSANVCYSRLKHRLAVVAHAASQAAAGLREQVQQIAQHGSPAASASAAPGRVAMLFTGQGSQYAGMGAALYRRHRLFRSGMDRCDELLRPLLQGQSLVRGLYGDESERFDLGQTQYAQPALFAIEHSLAAVWHAAGLKPDCLIGHSLGEYVAACLAGVFSLPDALKLVAHRGRLMQHRTPRGAMVALRGDERTVQRCLDELAAAAPADAAIAARNTATDAVISGEPDAVAAWVRRWQKACPPGDLQAMPLQVERAFHSPLMAGMLDEFAAIAREVDYHPPRIDLVSNLTGELLGHRAADPAYWVDHVMQPVDFWRGVQTLARLGCTVFVEAGPHPVLSAFGRQGIEGGTWLASLRRGADAEQQLLDSLGQWHVHGGSVDWRAWAQARFEPAVAAPQPVSLPPYPFELERHWFKAGAALPNETALHPLLGQRLALSGSSEQRFTARLSSRQPWFIDEHRAFGVPVLPMAAFIEAALAAVRHSVADPFPEWTLQDLALQGTLALPEGRSAELQCVVTALAGARGHQVALLARSRDSDAGGDGDSDGQAAARRPTHWSEWRPLAQARIAATGLPVPPSLDLPLLQAQLAERPLDGFYAQAEAMGLGYGPGLQGVTRLWLGEREALARIELPARVAAESAYHLHPAALDTCFHAALPFIAQALAGRPLALLPTAVSRLTVWQRLPARMWARGTWHGETSSGRFLADMDIHAEDGRCVASVRGMELALGSAHAVADAPAADALRFHRTEWLPLPASAVVRRSPAATGTARPWLIACADPALAQRLRQQAHEAGEAAYLIHAASAGAVAGADSAAVNWQVESDWQQLFEQLRARGVQPAGLIYHAKGAATARHEVPEVVDARAQAVLHACKQFLLANADTHPRVVILTRGAQVPPAAACEGQRLGADGLAQCAEAAMAKAIAPEFPQVQTLHVDLDPADPSDDVPLGRVFEALRSIEGSVQLALRDGQCLEARLREWPGAELPVRGLGLEGAGTWLVTGGLRGIGLATAQWLVDQGARSIALVGRRADAASDAAIRQLQERGATVRSFLADVADRDAIAQVLATVRTQMAPLRGIFHSAGVTHDMALGVMAWPQLQQVLAPKVRGAWHLHELTLDLELDHFVLYSSITSVVGNAGQLNHIAACSFLDALAAYRRHRGLAAMSINWGYWSETGVATRHDLAARMAWLGVGDISTAAGLHALQRLLGAQPVQCSAAVVDWPRIQEALFPGVPSRLLLDLGRQGPAPRAPAEAAAPPVDLGAALLDLPRAEAIDLILAYLLRLAGRILRLPAQALGQIERDFPRTPLNQLGFDSLMAVEMRNRIRREAGADVPLKHFLSGSCAAEVAELILARALVEQMAAPTAQPPDAADTDMETLTL